MNFIYALLIGIFAGVSSGLFGVGGGVIIVPLVAAVFGFTQQGAGATSLIAMLLPVGAFGVWQYYTSGFIALENVKYGSLIALGILIGTLFGAKIAVQMKSDLLAKLFSLYLLAVAIRIWWTAK